MKTKQPVLIVCTPGFAKDEADTTCLPMHQNLVRSLKTNYPGLTIIILSFQYPYCEKTYQWFDTTVISFNGQNKGGIKKILVRRKLEAVLKKTSNENNVIGILSFWYGECAWVGKKFADKYNLRHFCWLLGQDAKAENHYPKKLKAGANELIALSDFLQEEFQKNHGLRPAYIIPPGIDAKEFNSNTAQKDIDIIATGSLIPLKQFELFIKIIAAIKNQLPNIKAVLVGDGPELNKLEALIGANGLQSNIQLTGELPHKETLQWMQRARVFLHTSSYEGFGVVMIEALYAGCKVISFCKPMQQDIAHWHIVENTAAMQHKALELLESNLQAEKVCPFPINDSAKKIMQLFDL
jgi:glycosyltransferase involved in cell wall biosynthesis